MAICPAVRRPCPIVDALAQSDSRLLPWHGGPAWHEVQGDEIDLLSAICMARPPRRVRKNGLILTMYKIRPKEEGQK